MNQKQKEFSCSGLMRLILLSAERSENIPNYLEWRHQINKTWLEICKRCISDIKNNAWVTVNNDFLVTSKVIWAMIFTSDEVTSENYWQITTRVKKKIVIHGNKYIILFLTCYFMFWTHHSTKNNNQLLILSLSPRNGIFWLCIVTSPQLICDVTRTSIVTSYLLIVLAVQIDAKAIFTSE